MPPTVQVVDDAQLSTSSPYGKECTQDCGFRHSEFTPQYGIGLALVRSRQVWRGRYRRKSKVVCFLLSTSIKQAKQFPHVSVSTSQGFSTLTRLCLTSRPPNQSLSVKSAYSTPLLWYRRDIPIAVTSSGQSSPQTSFTSLIFSQSGSNSSRSTPSSQHSYSAVSPHPTHFSRRQPRIQVSSLLADSQTRSYHLEVVQHPQKTAEFGFASLSRLPLTPPVIAQLTVRDPSGNSVIPEAELPFLIAHLSLLSGDGLTPLDMGSSPGGGQAPPILYGNLVSSVHQLEDLQGNLGLFFLFPDVSIRWRGRFRLGIRLLRLSAIDSSGAMSIAEQGTVLADTRTRTFDVLAHNQYTAAPPTRLTQCFLRQGARMFTFMSNPNP